MKSRRLAPLLSAVVGVASLLMVTTATAATSTIDVDTSVSQIYTASSPVDWSIYRTAPTSLTWTQTADGLKGRSGQIFTANRADEYTITATAHLQRDYWSADGTSGGYGIFFDTSLGADNKDTGYVFQLDRGAGGIRIFQRVNGAENYGTVYALRPESFPTDTTDPWWTAEHTVTLQISRVAGTTDQKELAVSIDGEQLSFTKPGTTILQPYRFTSTITADQNYVGLRAWNTDTMFKSLSAVGRAATAAAEVVTPEKKTTEITLSCPESVVFTGTPQTPCTASASDAVSGEPQATPDITYSANVGTGVATATASLAESDTHLGATASATFGITGWDAHGFRQPVDLGGVLNVIKSGSTVPLKFEVFAGGVELQDPSVVTSFSATQVSCSAAMTDDVEIASSAVTGLRYDPTAGQFIQTWKTPANSGGQCFRTTVTLLDGQSLTALFKLK